MAGVAEPHSRRPGAPATRLSGAARPVSSLSELTEDGAARARIALAQASTSLATLGLRPRPATGLT